LLTYIRYNSSHQCRLNNYQMLHVRRSMSLYEKDNAVDSEGDVKIISPETGAAIWATIFIHKSWLRRSRRDHSLTPTAVCTIISANHTFLNLNVHLVMNGRYWFEWMLKKRVRIHYGPLLHTYTHKLESYIKFQNTIRRYTLQQPEYFPTNNI
jgi:hypothetical protein